MDDNYQQELVNSFGEELENIDESKLPEVLSKRMDALEKVNKQYNIALDKKEKAQAKVNKALEDADNLITEAGKLGKVQPETRKFLWHEYSNTTDKISALQKSLKELVDHSTDSNKYQKQLAEVQNSILESQTAVSEVQKCQMEYMQVTAKALKFLYALGCYGIGNTQGIVENLQLVLSDAKKKDLGEMAKEQMFLVMDQLKSQENLQIRLKNHKKIIDDLETQITIQAEKNEEYNERLKNGEIKDIEQDIAIKENQEKGKEHDAALHSHEIILHEQEKKDREHDTVLKTHEENLLERERKDKEHDDAIKAHEEKISAVVQKDEEINNALAILEENEQRNKQDIEFQRVKDEEHEKALEDLKEMVQSLIEENTYIKNNITNSASKKTVYIAVGLGVISLIVSILGLFI